MLNYFRPFLRTENDISPVSDPIPEEAAFPELLQILKLLETKKSSVTESVFTLHHSLNFIRRTALFHGISICATFLTSQPQSLE